MPRRPQFGSIYRRGNVWWLKYYKDGRPYYESSQSSKYSDAQSLLGRRVTEIVAGTHPDGDARRLKIGGLLDSLLLDYQNNGKDYTWAERVVRKHIRPFFGDMIAAKLSRHDIDKYIRQRQDSRAANASINKALALLHRAFALAREAGRIAIVPSFPRKLLEKNVRKGFFEHEQFIAVRIALPEEIKPVVTFAYHTGCRRGEILELKWSQVDLARRVIRLEPGETKNDEPRTIPLTDELYQTLAMQKQIRDQRWPLCEYVFFRQGKRIRDFRSAWDRACVQAELVTGEGKATRLFHDLRRTGVRNLVRAGVPERVAMAISGHKTRSVFDRYNIVSERDLREAAQRLDIYFQARESQADGDNLVTARTEEREQRGRKLFN